jgi:hypothetical protein
MNNGTSFRLSTAARWSLTCVLAVVAGVWLWSDHRDHVVSFGPYVLLLLCPIMHLFGHRRHRGQHS